ncbi:hypothetical protein [Enterobacter quasiroggenkampii]|uniref:hypothetical protein n=1 Tax=Enterobacter quasiroggenkampii TaxID=2497436 RepID=UPI0021CF5CF3|nr:hypothetical protein [Enterobacter quasiroggenkampii]
MEPDKPLHHHLACQRTHHRRRETSSHQAKTKYRGGSMAQQRLQREIRLVEIGNTGMTVKVESGGCCCHHRQIDKPRDGHGDRDVPLGGGVALFTRPTVEMLRQRGVQINHVRHDGRPQHPGGQEHRFRGWQAWDRHPFSELRQIRL